MKAFQKLVNWGVVIILGSIGLVMAAYFTSQLFLNNYNTPNASMAPTIPAGSKVFVQEQSEYRVGDVIAFQALTVGNPEPLVVIHRLVGFNHDGSLQTKGDANERLDAPASPVTTANIIGKMVWHVPVVGDAQIWIQGHWLIAGGGLMLLLVLYFATTEPKAREEEVVPAPSVGAPPA